MSYSLEQRLRLVSQVSNLMLAGSIQAYNDNRRPAQKNRAIR